MNTEPKYHILKIKEVLTLKQKENPGYSLRAYARDLGLHPATLSQILNGNRPFPLRYSNQVVSKLSLGPKEKTLFLESLNRSRITLDKINIDYEKVLSQIMLDESYHKIISEWEHYAVLTLFDVHNFRPTVQEISTRLNIKETRAEVVIENLISAGLLTRDEHEILKKVHAFVRATEDVMSVALRKSHKETLEIGNKKLDEVDIMLRDYSSTTVAVDLSKLAEAKTIIREFRQKMAVLLRDGVRTEVFQLAIQFYPLTTMSRRDV